MTGLTEAYREAGVALMDDLPDTSSLATASRGKLQVRRAPQVQEPVHGRTGLHWRSGFSNVEACDGDGSGGQDYKHLVRATWAMLEHLLSLHSAGTD